jgi:modulator of FtsH protease
MSIEAHKVLRQTYMLLSMTLLFSAAMAMVAMATDMPRPHFFIVLAGYIGLPMLTHALRNNGWGIVAAFAFTGFFGLCTGPMISAYLQFLSNGAEIIALAMGGTAVTFLGLSGYAMTTKRDFSGLGPFVGIGMMAVLGSCVIGFFLELPALALAISAILIPIAAASMLFHTQQIVRGGETNYISATVALFAAIANLFISLLHIFGFAFGED